MNLAQIEIEITESIKLMGHEAAIERLNFFKEQGAISDITYIKWLHLINGGSVATIDEWELAGNTVKKEEESSKSWFANAWASFWTNGRKDER